jgi:hypothetical protein
MGVIPTPRESGKAPAATRIQSIVALILNKEMQNFTQIVNPPSVINLKNPAAIYPPGPPGT